MRISSTFFFFLMCTLVLVGCGEETVTIRTDGTIEHLTVFQTEQYLRMTADDDSSLQADDAEAVKEALADGKLSPAMVEEFCDFFEKKDWRDASCKWDGGFAIRQSGVSDWGENVRETREGETRIFTYTFTVMVPEDMDDNTLERIGYYDGMNRIVMPGMIRSTTHGAVTAPDTVTLSLEELKGWSEVVIVSTVPSDESGDEEGRAAPGRAAFPDVPVSHPNSEAIDYVRSKGIVQGYPDGTYRPDQTINRAEFTKIVTLYKFGQEMIDMCGTAMGFSDVSFADWFGKYVCRARDAALIQGYPDGSFRPEQPINAVEAAKIIARTNSFNAGDPPLPPETGVWYERYIRYLAERNTIPVSITSFDQSITRGEMAEMIYRLQAGVTNKPSWTYEDLADRSSPNWQTVS